MSLTPIIITILGIIVVIALVIFYAVTSKKSPKSEIMPNSQIGISLGRTQFTDGYTIFSIKRMRKNKNGTTLVEGHPFDVFQGDDIPHAPIISFVVLDEYIKPLPRSKGSSERREIVFFVTRSSLDLPEAMRDTTEGKWMEKEGQMGLVLSVMKKMIPAGDEAIGELITTFSRGNISANSLAKFKEDMDKMVELRTGQRTKEEDH